MPYNSFRAGPLRRERLVAGSRVAKGFQSRMTDVFGTRVATLQSEIPTLVHQERASVLDRMAVPRNATHVLDHMYVTAIRALTWTARILSLLILLGAQQLVPTRRG